MHLHRLWKTLRRLHFPVLAMLAISGGMVVLAAPMLKPIIWHNSTDRDLEAQFRNALEQEPRVTVSISLTAGTTYDKVIEDRRIRKQLAEALKVVGEKEPPIACACRVSAGFRFGSHRARPFWVKHDRLYFQDADNKSCMVRIDKALWEVLTKELEIEWCADLR